MCAPRRPSGSISSPAEGGQTEPGGGVQDAGCSGEPFHRDLPVLAKAVPERSASAVEGEIYRMLEKPEAVSGGTSASPTVEGCRRCCALPTGPRRIRHPPGHCGRRWSGSTFSAILCRGGGQPGQRKPAGALRRLAGGQTGPELPGILLRRRAARPRSGRCGQARCPGAGDSERRRAEGARPQLADLRQAVGRAQSPVQMRSMCGAAC